MTIMGCVVSETPMIWTILGWLSEAYRGSQEVCVTLDTLSTMPAMMKCAHRAQFTMHADCCVNNEQALLRFYGICRIETRITSMLGSQMASEPLSACALILCVSDMQ